MQAWEWEELNAPKTENTGNGNLFEDITPRTKQSKTTQIKTNQTKNIHHLKVILLDSRFTLVARLPLACFAWLLVLGARLAINFSVLSLSARISPWLRKMSTIQLFILFVNLCPHKTKDYIEINKNKNKEIKLNISFQNIMHTFKWKNPKQCNNKIK